MGRNQKVLNDLSNNRITFNWKLKKQSKGDSFMSGKLKRGTFNRIQKLNWQKLVALA